jgi:hypothetical protein
MICHNSLKISNCICDGVKIGSGVDVWYFDGVAVDVFFAVGDTVIVGEKIAVGWRVSLGITDLSIAGC